MKNSHLGILSFLVSVLGLADFSVSQSSPDASSMQALKSSLNLTSYVDWSDPNPCRWLSVQCDSSNRVTRIQLKSKGIRGTLPPDLKNLTSLTVLEFFANQLWGPVPDLSGLSQLQRLNLRDNQFTSVPNNLFAGMTMLQEVYLDNNPLSSSVIPDSIKDATSLRVFSFINCNIYGKIPEFFGGQTLPNLVKLRLSYNKLESELPMSFAGSSIQSLWLNGQQSTGKLNGSISILQNMTALNEVWLHGNQFSGSIPDLSGLQTLRDFSVRDNQLTGIVPQSLVELPMLRTVNLTNNMLQGRAPMFAKGVQVDMAPRMNSFCSDDPSVACDPQVDILLSIVEAFGYPARFASSWKGNNPCDTNNLWDGISCMGSNVTTIVFKSRGLSGTISPNFAKLTSLVTINLADNALTGSIPTELAALSKLIKLDVSNNHLSGKVPKFRDGVVFLSEGNTNLGKDLAPGLPPSGTPSSSKGSGNGGRDGSGNGGREGSGSGNAGEDSSEKSTSVKIIGSVVGAVGALGLVGLGVCIYATKRKRPARVQSPTHMVIHPPYSGDQPAVKLTVAASSVNDWGSESCYSHMSNGASDVRVVEAGNMVISIQVLRDVTNNFSDENILGQGGFGTVYMGELHDGTKIAVKRMESSVVSDKGLGEFKSEIAVLTKVRHRHLVGLLGYCLDGNERLLVYEYMPQGTLSQHLFHWKEEGLKPLEWTRRLSIALDVARGVEYLHTLAHQSFIHRDLKPSNILLGDDMRAKVSDFGLVRLAPDGKHSIETRLAGTFGYLAPEYAVTGRVTTKVDIFSFGVILMELITGRRALDETQPEDSMHLVTWFRRIHHGKDQDAFKNAVDITIHLDDDTLSSVGKVSELAGHCCAREPYQRPDMGHIVNVLSSLVEQWKPSEPDPDDLGGIDYDMPLPQVVKKWKAFEGLSNLEDSGSSSSACGSSDNTQTSIPTRPSGFADSFTSIDGR